MTKKFSQFTLDETIQQTDIVVGLRDGINTQFNFPGDGVADQYGNWIVKWQPYNNLDRNYILFQGSPAGIPVSIQARGVDMDLGMVIASKNDGTLSLLSPGAGDVALIIGGAGNITMTTNAGKYILNGTVGINAILDEDNMVSNSDTAVPTQQSVKAYVDASTGALSDLTFVTNTDETADAPNSQPLSILTTGFATVTNTTGIIGTRVHTGTSNQITVANGDGSAGNPTYSLPTTLIAPGTFQTTSTLNIGGTGATVTSISTDGMLSADSDTLLVTEKAIKTYVDGTQTIIKAQTYVTNTNETAVLPNSQSLSLLSTGIVGVTTTTGILASYILTGTANQVTVTNGAGGANPTFSLPSTLIAPGTFEAVISINIGGSGATVTSISTDGTLAANSDALLSTQKAIKTYVDSGTTTIKNQTYVTNTNETATLPNSQSLSALSSGIVAVTTATGILNAVTLTGTANQVTVANGTGASTPTFSLPSTLIAPGTFQATTSINIGGSGATVTSISTDGTLAANSDTLIVTEKAVKTYVDNSATTIKNQTFVTNTNETATLPNSQSLSALSTGMVAVTTSTGILSAVTLTGTANQISIAGGTGASTPTFSLPSTLIAPGTFQATTSINIGGSGATVTSISTDGTLASNADTLLSSQKAIKTYVDTTETAIKSYTFITKTDNTANLPNSVPLSGIGTGFLANTTSTGVLTPRTMTGTTNQISVANGDGSGVPTFSLPSTLIAPGTFQATTSLNVGGAGATVTSISTDGTFAANVDTLLVSQKAIKNYVDNTVMPFQFATAALVATSNITLSGIQTVDGVVTTTQVVLAENQTSAVNNGLYTANILGAWTRTPGYTTWANFYRLIVSITGGLTQAGTSWQCTVGDTGTVGVNNLTFAAAAFQTYTAGTGLTLTDNIFSLTAPVPIALGGTNTTSAIGASGTLAQSDGSKYTFTTATYPATATSSGKILRADGTNWVASTPTFPNTGTSGKLIRGDGTNYVETTAQYPTASGSSGTLLQSDGTNIINTTATYPATSGTSGTILRSNGTNIVNSTATYPSTSGTSGTILRSDGTNIVNSTPTFPNSGGSGKLIRGDGTNYVETTAQYPNTAGTSGNVLTSDGTNWNSTALPGTVTNALTMNNSGSGAASGSTYNGGSAVTISYNSVGASPLAGSSSLVTVGTITSGTWTGTTIASANGGTGFSTYTTGDLIHASATNTLSKLGIGSTGQVLTVASGDISWAAAPLSAITWSVVTGTSVTGVARNGYIANNAGTVTVTLPSTAAVGDNFAVTGINNATGWKLAVASGQTIYLGTAATTASTGYLQSTNTRDSVAIICVVANTTFQAVSSVGNITVV